MALPWTYVRYTKRGDMAYGFNWRYGLKWKEMGILIGPMNIERKYKTIYIYIYFNYYNSFI